MKNKSVKNKFQNNNSGTHGVAIQNLPEEETFSSQAVKSTMTEQLIAPPARVWDKIEKVLDQQEHRRKEACEIIANTFNNKTKNNNKETSTWLP
jgi:hypothetical protein